LNWLIALREEPDNAELCDRFDVWLSQHGDNVSAWQEAQNLWNVMGQVPHASQRCSPASISGWRRHMSRRALHKAGAGAIAAVCLMALALPSFTLWLEADYSTSVAESREIHLEDGSTVFLGAESALAVDLAGQDRRIRLLTGEAYFEVAPDPRRPFKVTANDVTTTVLGTGFDVKLSSQSVAVAVEHGRVGVSSPRATDNLTEPLVAGDWVRVASNGDIERGNADPETAASWRRGLLVVRDQSVGDVIDVIRRHLQGKIVIVDPGLEARRVTGVYDLKRPLDALSAVAEVHGAKLRGTETWLNVVSRY
jgi:transmembrane sensor